eukprot:1432399-Prymnesium_polylepis.1
MQTVIGFSRSQWRSCSPRAPMDDTYVRYARKTPRTSRRDLDGDLDPRRLLQAQNCDSTSSLRDVISSPRPKIDTGMCLLGPTTVVEHFVS